MCDISLKMMVILETVHKNNTEVKQKVVKKKTKVDLERKRVFAHMKLSKFNKLFEVDGRNYFYNIRTGAIAEVFDDFLSVITEINNGSFREDNFSSELITNMVYAGAIINDDYNEHFNLAYQNNIVKYSQDKLIITVIPTFECNCRCSYCYEKKVKGVISQRVKEGILNFIKTKKSITSLNIIWFGGEPLLCREHVYDLSCELLQYCTDLNISYSSSMVTNLTLLQADDIEKLKKSKIFWFQVTLDGPENIHNRRRFEFNEINSFKKIIANIKLLLQNDFKVDLRINIDKSNVNYISELLQTVKNEIGIHANLTLYPARVSSYNINVCSSAKSNCIDTIDDWSDTVVDFFRQCIKFGFINNILDRMIPKPTIVPCSAEFANSFTLDPEGNLYKCSLTAGQKDKAFQNVCNATELNTTSNNYLKWIVPAYTNFKQCNECKLLPICMGGCRLLRCDSDSDNPVCSIFEKELNKYLINFIKFKLI